MPVSHLNIPKAPNLDLLQALCIGGEPSLTSGGRAWVWAGLQQSARIGLNTITIEVSSSGVNSQLGVPVNAIGIAQIKVNSSSDDVLATACQLFLGKSVNTIQSVALETLEGHQRAIIGNMTVEEMFRDRVKFSDQVFQTASADMLKLGLQIVSYTLKSLQDDNGYLRALGATEIAETQCNQRISEAQNQRDATVKEWEARQLQRIAELNAETEKTKQQLLLELRRAANSKEVGTETAKAELANRLQDALTRQGLVVQEMQVKLIEKKQQTEVQKEEILRVEKHLQASVIKPAEAEVYTINQEAQAKKQEIVLRAEAEAESIQMKAEARAYAITEKSKAEAEQLRQKAEAFSKYKEAALVDVVLKIMPQIAAEITEPMNNINKITMIASGDGQIGAARITEEVLSIMEKLPNTVKALTGIDISQDLKSITNRR